MFRRFFNLHDAVLSAAVLTLAAWLSLASAAAATTIGYSYDEDARPSFDPDGTKLKKIVTAAAQIWSDYINAYTINPANGQLLPAVYSFDLSYDNTDENELGYYSTSFDYMVIDTSDASGAAIPWYFDPTPLDNSEFNMHQYLVRELDAADPQAVDNAYDGVTMPLMEAAYRGEANTTAAMGKYDLLTVVLHEMGHMLGYNWNPNDDDYDFPSSAIGGGSLAVNENSDMHGGVAESLMYPSVELGIRKLPGASDILGLYDEGNPMTFDLPRQDYLGAHSTNWQDTLNWIGGAVPDGDNQAFVRNGGLAIMSADGSAASLTITDGSQVFVNNHQFRVLGDTTLTYDTNGDGKLNIGSLTSGISRFETQRLNVKFGMVNLQNAFSTLVVNRDMAVDYTASVMGAGRIEVGGTLTNNGEIWAGAFQLLGFSGALTLASTGAGKLDLDGTGGLIESGRIRAVGGNLVVAGPLADDFDGTATIGAAHAMWFYQPWKNHGKLEFRGGSTVEQAAWLGSGGLMTFDGLMDVDGLGMIGSPLTLSGQARIQVPDANDQITFAGPTLLRAAAIEGAGSVAIAGRTTVHLPNPLEQTPTTDVSQTYKTTAVGPQQATNVAVLSPDVLNDPDGVATQYPTSYTFPVAVAVKRGGVLLAYGSSLQFSRTTTMAGGRLGGLHTVNQIGDLVVEGPSIINPTTFLWGVDATNHKTTLRTQTRLDLTPGKIVRTGTDNVYRGAIKLESNSHLHVDLGSATSWRLAGSMQLDSGAVVSGDNLVNNGLVSGNGSFEIARFENGGRVAPGRVLGGLKMLTTAFVQTSAGVLDILLGQSPKGNGSGLLTVGTAQLAGTLALTLDANFSPAVGSEFDVLRASSISGTFSNVSLTGSLATQFQGSLTYRTDRVTFRITKAPAGGTRLMVGAVPEPSAAALAVMAIGLVALRGRRS